MRLGLGLGLDLQEERLALITIAEGVNYGFIHFTVWTIYVL